MIGKRRSKQKRKPVSMESDWACLPRDLLVSILDRLVRLSDYVRFSAVCMPWHAVALKNYHGEKRHKLSMHQPPLLILADIRSSNRKNSINIYSISQNKTYKLKSFVRPSVSQKWCGSSHGWLVSVDNKLVITLSHPFYSNDKRGEGIIRLQRVLLISHTDHIVKVILSADPIVAPDDYTVMVICNPCGKLGFIRPRDKAWTFIKGSENIVNVIYSKGLFYALDKFGSLKTCDISEHCPKLNEDPFYTHVSTQVINYIVESAGGDLLQLVRFVVCYDIRNEKAQQIRSTAVTEKFKVFKLLVLNGEPKWVETRNLGNGALFLGDITSTYVSAHSSKKKKIYVSAFDFLECQPNSIYFTEYCRPRTYYVHYDMCIFNLEDGSLQRDCVSKFWSSQKEKERSRSVFSDWSPCWIEPTFQGKKA